SRRRQRSPQFHPRSRSRGEAAPWSLIDPERSARNARVAKDLLVVGAHERQVLRILWESRSFAPAALRMTSPLASRGRERETTLLLSFLPLKQRAACHPERSARNARVA